MRLVSFAFALMLVFTSNAMSAVVIGAFASPRQGELALVGGGTFGQTIASFIVNNYPGAQLVGTQQLTTSFLSTVDMVIVNSASGFGVGTTLSASEQTALLDFVRSGKGAIVIADGNPTDAGNSFGAPFGVTTGQATSSQGKFTAPTHPVASGPFGTVSTFFVDPIGDADAFFSIGPYASVIGRAGIDGSGAPVVLSIPEGQISPGSGRVILFSDAVIPGWSALTNTGLLLNAIDYVSRVPEISSSGLAGIGMMLAGVCLAMRRGLREVST
ncbi:hypothetical protein K2X85_11330 [bacterium]|nr:hypothetical protein [bacterium]